MDRSLDRMSSSSSSPIYLGLDLGTQSVRAMAVSATGETLGLGAQPLTSRRDGPRHEQEPEEWWRATTTACRAALADLPRERIRGMAVDATSGTILLIDDAGRALTPGLMYDDARAVTEAKRATEAGASMWAALGYQRMQATWGLSKLLWLRRERPELFTATTRLAHQSDFINRRLVGELLATDTSNALKTGCDPRVEDWPREIFAALDVPSEILPPVVRSGTRLGSVCAGAAAETSIPEGSAIFAGMTDGCAAQIDLDALGTQAANRGPANAIAYPLAGRGERFPFHAPDAEGFLLGKPRDELDHYAALLQGVAFIERFCFAHLEKIGAPIDGDLLLTGGGAKSRAWCQLRADILGRSVKIPENAEAAFGMAILAAAEGRSIAEAAAKMVRIRETLDPRPERTRQFAEPYQRLIEELARCGWLAAPAREGK
jgi:D-ribulokinase